MKIQICGSMKFAPEMKKVAKELSKKGFEVTLPTDVDLHIKDPKFADDLEGNIEHCLENDVIRENFKLVSKADAILVLNFPKNGTDGYIGASSLMEMGIAHFLKKKIFLMFPPPHFRDHRWAHEVTIMGPKILGGDLSKI